MVATPRSLASVFCAAGLLTGCASNLPVVQKLGDLRVLAIKAEPPEVRPGARVTVTPLISDLEGAGRRLTYTAEACSDVGASYGREPSCEGVEDRVVLKEDQEITPGSGTGAPFNSLDYTGTAPPILVTVPIYALSGRNEIDQTNGVAYIIIYRLRATNADGSVLERRAFKRLIASGRKVKNKNPVVDAMRAGTESLAPGAAFSSETLDLSLALKVGADESYERKLADGTVESAAEEARFSWFVSDGEIAKATTYSGETARYTPPAAKPARGRAFVITVVRDGRGGEDFFKQNWE